MKKENVTISFESEQLAALEFSLKKKNSSVQAQLEELLKCLYESEVPEPVREYLASRTAPAARPRRPARPAKPQDVYKRQAFVREQDESLSFGRDRELAELMEQVGGLLPTDALRQRDAPEQSGMTMK